MTGKPRRAARVLARLRRALHLTRRGFRYLRWTVLAVVAILLAVYVLFPNITWESETVRARIETEIQKALTRPVTVARARMNLLGEAVLNDVTIYAGPGDTTPLALCPKMIIEFSYRPLNDQPVAVKAVTAWRPEVFMEYNRDGTWNSSGLFAKGETGVAEYRTDVEIRDGHYVLIDHRVEPPVVWNCYEVEGDLVIVDRGEFSLTFKGESSVEKEVALKFNGTVYPSRGLVNVRGRFDAAPAEWFRPYAVAAGVELVGGKVGADLDLHFRGDGHSAQGTITPDGVAATVGELALPAAPGARVELKYLSLPDRVQLQQFALQWGGLDLKATGELRGPADYALQLSSPAFPAGWVTAAGRSALAGFRLDGTVAGDLNLIRAGSERTITGDFDLRNLAFSRERLVRKPAGQPLRVALAATSDSAGTALQRLVLSPGAGELRIVPPTAAGNWRLELAALPAESLQSYSPLLRETIAAAGVKLAGPLSGTVSVGGTVSGDLELSQAELEVGTVFRKAKGIGAACGFTLRDTPLGRQLKLNSWKIGRSRGAFSLLPQPGGWAIEAACGQLNRGDLFRAFPGLGSGALAHLDWDGEISGKVAVSSDTVGLRYFVTAAAPGSFVAWKGWWRKPAAMPLTVTVTCREQGDRFTLDKGTLAFGGSTVEAVGAFDAAGRQYNFTVHTRTCRVEDILKTFSGLGEGMERMGDWGGEARGTAIINGTPERTDYYGSLNLDQAQVKLGDEFQKLMGVPATLDYRIEEYPARLDIRLFELRLGQSRLVANGAVYPRERNRVDLTLKGNLFTPEVKGFIPNLDRKRIVGYPATELISALRDRENRILLEWKVQGTFDTPEFQLDFRQALAEGLRRSVDAQLRVLGKVVGGLISLPFRVLGIISDDPGRDTAPRR